MIRQTHRITIRTKMITTTHMNVLISGLTLWLRMTNTMLYF